MKTWLYIALLGSLCIAPACTETVEKEGACDEFALGEPFEAKVHDIWCLENGALSITFGSILDDSRCNIDGVECVWAGKFTMIVDVDLAGDIRRDTLDAIHNWRDTIQAGAYDIALIKVLPEIRFLNNLPDTADYTLRMLVE